MSIAPYAFLTVLAVLLFWPLLFGGNALYFGDIGLYFVPLLDFQRHELLAGRIPLWNPHVWCGTPFWGNPQSWPLYPSSTLLYVLSAERAVGVMGAFHCLWASWGTFAFLRRIGRSSFAALLGAIAWGFGGHLVSKMQFPNMVQAASYLPWLLWAVEGVILRPSVRRGALLALLVGLALLAAHPQMFVMQFYGGSAYLAWRCLSAPKSMRVPILGMVAAAFLLGVCLASGYLLPVAQMARESVRAHLTIAAANRFILPPYALTNFVAPDFFGNPQTNPPFVARGNFWEAACYAGIVPFLLALAGAALFWRRANVRFWTICAVVGIWLSLGRDAGLYVIAFHFLPGVAQFHDAARWLHLGTFALAVLAASGLDGLLRDLKHGRIVVGVLLLGIAACDLLSHSATLNPTLPATIYDVARSGSKTQPAERAWYADENEAWARYVSYRSYDNVNTPENARAFFSSRMPNLFMLTNRYDAAGYEPVHRADMDTLLTAIRRDGERSPLLSALGIETAIEGQGRTLRPVGKLINPSLGRAQLWQTWRGTPSQAEALAHVTRSDWDGVPVIEGVEGKLNGPNNPQRAVITERTPQRVTVILSAPHGSGLLVLTDACHPGWIALVDGKPVALLRVNGALRGVFVSSGSHRVQFIFDPVTVRFGAFTSFVGAGILTAVFVGSGAARRKNRSASGRSNDAIRLVKQRYNRPEHG